ncbi:GRAS domain-containing protein [Psidium guajava]|nr:GRAS domain-containing protein [Psidium guajava]
MFSLATGKALGPDGFNVEFFKETWDITGHLVTAAIKEFFPSGNLLKEINSTIIALIPKIPNASKMGDFRPISCCNTVYKCITKILANRIAAVIPSVINPSQSAFVKGRRISDNILIAQELFSGFHLNPYSPKCAIKVDFQKAYDTVNWDFLELVLLAFGFPRLFADLVMECVRSPKFSISINGELHGFFSSGRGIRQGDPMSPYLFTLVMETFSGILDGQATLPGFKFFWRCKPTRLTHLFFADDVLLFSEANMESVTLLKDGLQKFTAWSGLNPNDHKSEIYYSGKSIALKNQLLEFLGFAEGKLPFRYLGVPIVSKRLSKADCHGLVDYITARAQSWSHRFLSFAGRLQLITSVLRTIYNFWAGVFILPKAVLNCIERVLRQFLWTGAGLSVGGAKVSWSHVCLPKNEGGLGIRRMLDCNKAAMLKHIWILFSDKESLWCKWIHSNFLKNKNFWLASKPTFCSWAWKKILELRPLFLSRSQWQIGDGTSISFWFDPWHANGPLYKAFSDREIYLSGVFRMASVRDFIDGQFLANSVLDRLHTWSDFPPIIAPARRDCLIWLCHPSGSFSVASAWDDIRRKGSTVFWHHFI